MRRSVLAIVLLLSSGCSRMTPEVSRAAESAPSVASANAATVVEPPPTVPPEQVAELTTAVCGPAPILPSTTPDRARTPTPRPTQTRLRDLHPALGALHTASQVIITRERGTLSPVTPMSALYTVARAGDQFTGDVHFEVAGRLIPRKEQTLPVSIPTALMVQVLNELSLVKVSPGPYKPWIAWTDDLQENTVRVKFGRNEILFQSQSLGDGHVPWSIDISGQTMVAESGDIAVALKRLEPCLHLDTFQQMIQAAFDEGRSQGR
jgi:hypothetical protein